MQLAFRSAGDGGRPLLLLHGLASSSADMERQLDPLARRGWHAVAPDLRGHGLSPKPADESAYALGALGDDVLELADALGWDRFALFGHELGGAVAQEAAIRGGDRVVSLILQATSAGAVPLDRNLAEGGIELVRGAASMEPLVHVYRAIDTGPLHTRREHQDAVLERMVDCAPAAYASLLGQLLDAADRSVLLAELDVPTMVLVGGDDEGFIEAAADLAAVIRRADLGILPSSGHCPHVEAPDEWLAFVLGFLQASLV